jgi:hypothetical protein
VRRLVLALIVLGLLAVGAIAGCGGSADLKGAPDVRGLSLPSAETVLHKKGYAADVSTGALFGVIVKDHYTVCSESTPDNKLVPVKVEKEC